LQNWAQLINSILEIQSSIIFYLVVFAIVYIETAIIFAFFIPGDTLLFTIGTLVALNAELNILISMCLIASAAFLGDQTAYFIGNKSKSFYTGKRPALSKIFKKGEIFYEKHGIAAIALSRFYPWFRTIIPFLAGFNSMNYRKFVFTNFGSAFIWGFGITWLGYIAISNVAIESGSKYIAAFFVTLTVALTSWNIFKNRKYLSRHF